MPTHLSRSSRDRVLDAAAHLIATAGLARATTKEIARGAGLSEAMLYKHFRSKEDLFLAVLSERVPGIPLLRTLPERVGRDALPATLTAIATAVIEFYGRSLTMTGSMLAEPHLLATLRTFLAENDRGPQLANAAVAGYLKAEQRAGRIRADADCAAVAHTLLGGCLYWAYLGMFTDRLPFASTEECAGAVAATVLPALT